MDAHFKLALKYKNLFSFFSVSVNSEILSSDPSDEEIFIISFICVQYLVYCSSFFLKSKPSFFYSNTKVEKKSKLEKKVDILMFLFLLWDLNWYWRLRSILRIQKSTTWSDCNSHGNYLWTLTVKNNCIRARRLNAKTITGYNHTIFLGSLDKRRLWIGPQSGLRTTVVYWPGIWVGNVGRMVS